MAKSPKSPQLRLQRIEAARSLFVARLVGDQTLGASPMAKALGVTWVTLREWCDDIEGFEESRAFERGGNGVEYKFRPLATMDFLASHFRSEVEKAQSRHDEVSRMVTGSEAGLGPQGLDLDEMTKMLRLSNSLQDRKERDGRLLDAEPLRSKLEQCFAAMAEAGMMAAQEADPTGRWEPETREIVEDVVRRMLLKQHRAAEDMLKETDGHASQPGLSGAGHRGAVSGRIPAQAG